MSQPSARRLTPAAAVVTALVAAACADPAVAPRAAEAPAAAKSAAAGAPGQPIPGQYIVVFRDAVADVGGKVREKALRANARPRFVYDAALKGFAAALSDDAVRRLRADPDVAYVEQDQVMSISATQAPVPSWGIDRIDRAGATAARLNNSYAYTRTGAGVTAYIIDTGIRFSHADFGGRASKGYDAVTAGGTAGDCNGHGTHVAGTVGGASYGVAKGAGLVAVRVLDCNGSGSTSGVVAGMDWVTANARKPAVANMSLGGGASSAIDAAVQRMTNAGVFLAVAAGNGNFLGVAQDACSGSPSRAPSAVTVAASTNADAKASYSNYGRCVDLYAPGSGITSAWIGSDTDRNTISGTSMATPHVVGVGALYLQGTPAATPAQVASWITGNAESGVISGNPRRTANLLLNKRGL